MSDVLERLHRLADAPSGPATDTTVRGDLQRAHRAVRHRRVRLGVAGLAAAAVAVGGATVLATSSGTDTPARDLASPSDTRAAGIELVAYTGDQEPGFVVEKVPAGFVLQGATPYNLNVVRPGDTSGINDFQDKLVVMLQSSSVVGPPEGEPVRVGAHEGWLKVYEDGTQLLTYSDGEHLVEVQAWSTLGLTDEQVVEFAEGVTVTADAKASVG